MADTTKTIKNASNSELSAILYRVRKERDCLQLLKDIQAMSTPNARGPFPDWEKLGPFSTETIVYEGKSIKQMNDQELSEYFERLRTESELMNVIQNIQRYNKPMDPQVSSQSIPYSGLDLNTPIKDLYHKDIEKTLEHFGVLGMHWGVRRGSTSGTSSAKSDQKIIKNAEKRKTANFVSAHNATIREMNTYIQSMNSRWASKMSGYDNWMKSPDWDKYLADYSDGYQKALNNFAIKDSNHNHKLSDGTTLAQRYLVTNGEATLTLSRLENPNVNHADLESFEDLNVGATGLSFDEQGRIQPFEELSEELVDATLKHFGIPGMKWGVRRAKNSRRSGSEDYQKMRDLKKKGRKNLSNAELKAVNERLQLERSYKDLNPNAITKGKKFLATTVTVGTGIATLYALSNSKMVDAVKTKIADSIIRR